MTLLFSTSCFVVAFAPALLIFVKIVARDPLRVILFVVGGFFWLLSLLLSAAIWWIISDYLVVSIFVSVGIQELWRFLYFFLLHRAQSGLAKLASNGVEVSSIRLLYSSRHVLAIVCGLGMGVVAALFLLTNILADYSHDGVVGLPSAITPQLSESASIRLYLTDARFPLYYSLSCSMLVLFHVCWTVSMWDAAHKYFHHCFRLWFPGFVVAIASHIIDVLLSLPMRNHPALSLTLQAILLASNFGYCYIAIATPQWLPAFLGGRPTTSTTRTHLDSDSSASAHRLNVVQDNIVT
jgi:anterior pharynx defective protein 1